MRIAYALPLILTLLLGLGVSSVLAAPPSEAEFDYWQDYNWGPADYYGQDVSIHYVATNTWVLNMKDNGDGTWTVKQELTQNGKAYVYDITRVTLLDEKNFRVVEITHGIVDYEAIWYHYTYFEYIDEWEYHWIITSVYHYVGTQHDGTIYDPDTTSFDYWVKGVGWTHMWP